MSVLDRSLLASLAAGVWALVGVLLAGQASLLGYGTSGESMVTAAAADVLHPDPQALPERDVPDWPENEAQLRRAITGCRVEGEVTGARWSGTIHC